MPAYLRTQQWQLVFIIAILNKKKKIANISCKDEHNKGQKQYGPNRSIRYKKRGQEYIEELYKKDLHDPDNHNGVITGLDTHPGM